MKVKAAEAEISQLISWLCSHIFDQPDNQLAVYDRYCNENE